MESDLLSRRRLMLGTAAALAGSCLPAPAEADVPVPYDWNATPPMEGNAYVSDSARVPTTLGDSAGNLADSKLARNAFGGEVVDHYLNAARVELAAYDSAVTDWELVRGFERL